MHVLRTDCHIAVAHTQADALGPDAYKGFKAIWDTGATGCVITQSVVDAVGLKPTGMKQVHGVAGIHTCETYLVNIRLPNKVQFASVEVTKGILPGGEGGDILLGMDVITTGDFAVTNMGGQTVFSFRVPSQTHIDFVQDAHAANKAKAAQHTQAPKMMSRQERRAAERKAAKGKPLN
ncbi:retropepsin-like domain-containing protein [Variovorax paradoxus]|nr:retropepsin-like domain-containing protein [Variovorax paradoxus]